MQNNKTNIDQPDKFCQLAKNKLEGHRIPVGNELWNNIDSRMKPKRRPLAWWLGGIAASIVVVFTVWMFAPTNNPADVVSIETNIKSVAEAKKQDEHIINKPIESVRLTGQNKNKTTFSKKENSSDEKAVIPIAISDVDSLHFATIINNNFDNEYKESKSDSSTHKIENKKQFQQPKLLIKKNNKNQKWLLAALVSSGANVSTKGADDAQYPLFSSNNDLSTNLPDYAENIMNKDDFTESSHSLPLSFGLMVRKDFNKQFAIETGLMYTYLASTYKLNGIATYDAKQQLHYLGIPLNVVGYIYTAPKWNLYISGGGMIEKGISQKYTQTMQTSISTVQTKQNQIWINGIQWSLNASIGVSYNIYNDLNIYFEPRYSYMFDNKQPTSYRTENKNTFGLSGGLRYEF